MDMAAFRALSLLRRGFASVAVDGAGFGAATGFDFCASLSGTLTLALSCKSVAWPVPYWPDARGDLVSFTSGFGPAIEVSGMPVFRGGGGRLLGNECGS